MVSSTFERAGIPPRSEPSPLEPAEFVPWKGLSPREVTTQELNEGAPSPQGPPAKGKVNKKRSE